METLNEQKFEKIINKLAPAFEKLNTELHKKIVGQEQTLNSIITAILCNGHCLLIGAPGLAKTLMIKTISETLGLSFNRVQFTPDLMPADIIGSDFLQIDNLNSERRIVFNKGPVFTNILLADEINRTPPKTQSALLEAMQELSVTAGGKKYELPQPFFTLATQNPIEQEGTYPLPEAQLDRFMFSIKVDYPKFEEERLIVKMTTVNTSEKINCILTRDDILLAQSAVREIMISDELIDYSIRIARSTRPTDTAAADFIKKNVQWGAGPRASQFIILAAKANALLNGRMYCKKEDIYSQLNNILAHRIILNFNAMAENITVEDVINFIKDQQK